MKSDNELSKVKPPDEGADRKPGFLVACNQEIPCKIPHSYKIAQETLEKVTEIMNEEVNDTVSLLKAFADPIRLRILKTLRIEDLCVCVFVELMNCEYSKLSYHLKLLKEAGLIDSNKDGKFLTYHLTELGAKKVSCFGLSEFTY
ncbi:MAG: metalloregulator ArsR/SmtB family transcription factor [Euryarchaeota archaeon]|nr:metalloregulator ArsR/SmtB family transcription factor [Euryarchaeota archaeon]